MMRSLIRIRKNPDELLSYIVNRWKLEKQFAASSYRSGQFCSFLRAGNLKQASQLPCCMTHL